MTARTGAALIRRRLVTRPTAAILLAVLLLAASLLGALAPRALARQTTAEVADRLARTGAVARSIQGIAPFTPAWAPVPAPGAAQVFGGLTAALRGLRDAVPRPARAGVGDVRWIVQAPVTPVADGASGAALELTADPETAVRIRYTSGRAPAAWTGVDAALDATTPPVDVAISSTAADALHLTVGDVVQAVDPDGGPRPRYRVSGVFEPVAASDEDWAQHPSLLTPEHLRTGAGIDLVSAGAFVAPGSVGGLERTFSGGRISLYLPVRTDIWDGRDAAQVRSQLTAATGSPVALPGDDELTLSTGAPAAIDEALSRVRALSALLSLVAAAPAGVLLAVLALAARGALARWRPDLELAAARGASPLQLRAALAAVGALVAVPVSAIAAVASAIAVPARLTPAEIVTGPAVVAATVVAVLAAAVPSAGARRIGAILRRFSDVALGAVVVLAVLAYVILRQRGVVVATVSGLPDPLAVGTPLLLSIAAAALVMRVYPGLLRLALRLVRARGAASFVGGRRAARTPIAGAASAAALLIGVSTALLSVSLLGSVDAATAIATRQAVGADARLDATPDSPLDPARVAAAPGVEAAAGLQHLAGQFLQGARIRDSVAVVVAQTGPLTRMRPALAGVDLRAKDATAPVPVAASADLTPSLAVGDTATLGDVEIRIVAVLPDGLDLGPARAWLLADAAAAPRLSGAFGPDTVLVRGTGAGLDAALRRAAPGADVTTTAAELAERRSEPAVAAVRNGLLAGAAGSLLLAVVAVALSVVAAGAARARMVGVLRTLGMRSAGVRVLVAWELAPVGVAAVLAGCGLGAVLPSVLASAADLVPLLGASAPPPAVDPAVLAVIGGGFAVVTALAGAVAVAIGSRLDPLRAARMGSE